MNIERIITMIIRQVSRRFITRGIDAGIDMASRGKRARQGGSGASEQLTPEEHKHAAAAKDAAKRARQAARLTRRMR